MADEISIPVNIEIPAATLAGLGILPGTGERDAGREELLRQILAKALRSGSVTSWADIIEIKLKHRDEPDGPTFTITLDQLDIALGYIADDDSGVSPDLRAEVRAMPEMEYRVPAATWCGQIVQVAAFGEVLHP